jgi:predicted phage-related endonuclease
MTQTKLIPKGEHGSLEWLRKRWWDEEGRSIVGASEVPTVMQANPYESAIDLAIRKLQPPVVSEPNDAMLRGNLLEPALIKYASMQLGVELATPNCMYLRDRIICTLDAQAEQGDMDYFVECKTNNRWSLNDEIPQSWWWQAQAQMYALQAGVVTFSVLDSGLRLGLFEVQRSDDAINAMVTEVERFCNAIDDGKLPDDSPLSMEQVSALYPKPAGEVELSADVLQDIEQWNAIKDAIKQLEADEKRIKNKLADALRDAEFGMVNGAKVLSYKAQTTRRLDTKGLAFAHPQVADAFMTDSTFRVLRTIK